MHNYVISCQQVVEKPNGRTVTTWAYLCKENGPFGVDWFFSSIGGTPYKFSTVRDAQKVFKNIKENLLRQLNLSSYDMTTLAVRKICYKDMAKLELIVPDEPDTEIRVGDYCFSRDDTYGLDGYVTEIYDDGTCILEFCSNIGGGSVHVALDDLIPRRAVK